MTNLSDGDYATLAGFRYALRQFARYSEAAAEKAGLTPRQHQALLAIRAGPGGTGGGCRSLSDRRGCNGLSRPLCSGKILMRIAYVINSVEGGGAALPVPAVTDVLSRGGAEVRILALTRRDGRAIPPMEAAGLDVIVREGGEKDHVAALRWLDRQIIATRPTHLWTSLSRATLLGQLAGARRTRSVRHRQRNRWLALKQGIDQGGFTGTRRCCNHEQGTFTLGIHRVAPKPAARSTYRTASRFRHCTLAHRHRHGHNEWRG